VQRKDDQTIKHIVSFSGGKDSMATLLIMLDKGMPIDDIIFADTGLEFPVVYDYLEKVEEYIGRKITRLKHPTETFESLFYKKKIRGVYRRNLWFSTCKRMPS